ncbi:hypothetical protein STEG23_001035, partial [Scotinomys teguina]
MHESVVKAIYPLFLSSAINQNEAYFSAFPSSSLADPFELAFSLEFSEYLEESSNLGQKLTSRGHPNHEEIIIFFEPFHGKAKEPMFT